MLHTVLDLHLTQLVNSIKCQTGKKKKTKKKKNKKLRAHSPNFFSTKSVQQASKQMT